MEDQKYIMDMVLVGIAATDMGVHTVSKNNLGEIAAADIGVHTVF